MLRLQDKHRQTRFSRSASARRSPQPLPETVGLLAPQYKHQRHDQLCFLSGGLSCLGYHYSGPRDANITKTVLSLCFTQKFCPALVTTTQGLTMQTSLRLSSLCASLRSSVLPWLPLLRDSRYKHHTDGPLSASLRRSVQPGFPLAMQTSQRRPLSASLRRSVLRTYLATQSLTTQKSSLRLSCLCINQTFSPALRRGYWPPS